MLLIDMDIDICVEFVRLIKELNNTLKRSAYSKTLILRYVFLQVGPNG